MDTGRAGCGHPTCQPRTYRRGSRPLGCRRQGRAARGWRRLVYGRFAPISLSEPLSPSNTQREVRAGRQHGGGPLGRLR